MKTIHFKSLQKIISIILIAALCFSFLSCSKEKEVIAVKPEYTDEASDTLSEANWCCYSEDYLQKLREKYKLDELVKDCTTEFEKVQVVTEWVTGLWKHDGSNEPKQWDAMYILDQVTEHGERYRCVEYGEVIYGCLSALGITSRALGLKTSDVETRASGAGHVGTEAYLKDLDKWVFIDGQWGIIPLLGETPLNAVEFGKAITEDDKDLKLMRIGENYNDTTDKGYYQWIYEYIYYLDVNYYEVQSEDKMKSIQIMLIPKGAKEPTIFQNKYPLDVDRYTTSVKEFYPKIKE